MRCKNKKVSFREKVIKLWICYCLFVCFSTEILSLFNIINRTVLLIIYFGIGLVLLVLFIKKISSLKFKIVLIDYWGWYFSLFVFIFLPLFLIALYYPPNNYDSMTYHLSRVEHWIQNNNVTFFTTNNDRQLFMPPLAEYIVLHWRLLVGEDNLVNLVQYLSMTLSVILSTLLIKAWKGSKLTEALAATLVATIPIGIMQSTSTQTDYVVAFFVLATVYFCFKNNLWYLSFSIGLGIFTKSTYIIFVLPFGIYWLTRWIKSDGLMIWKKIFLILAITVLINFPQWQRNYQHFGSLLGSKVASADTFNQSFKLKYIISNITRNIGTQIGLPNTEFNLKIDNIVDGIHQMLGIKMNDFANTFYSEKYQTQFSINEDLSGNFLIIILFILIGIILIFKRYSIWPIYISFLIGWLLFNILFKWQPWHSRLELPFFVVICPLIAFTLTKFIKNNFLIEILIVIILFLSWPFVLGFIPFDKEDLYINNISNRPFVFDIFRFNVTRYERFIEENTSNLAYSKIAIEIKSINAKNIYLDLGGDSVEYPLWVALRHEKINAKVCYLPINKSSFGNNSNVCPKIDALIYDSYATHDFYDANLVYSDDSIGIKMSVF